MILEFTEGLLQVFQVIGRSTRATTKECFGDGSLATTLVDTLSDVSSSVQEAICFAICNLCATASCPARRRLLEKVPLLFDQADQYPYATWDA
jgi:hypothetical protein